MEIHQEELKKTHQSPCPLLCCKSKNLKPKTKMTTTSNIGNILNDLSQLLYLDTILRYRTLRLVILLYDIWVLSFAVLMFQPLHDHFLALLPVQVLCRTIIFAILLRSLRFGRMVLPSLILPDACA